MDFFPGCPTLKVLHQVDQCVTVELVPPTAVGSGKWLELYESDFPRQSGAHAHFLNTASASHRLKLSLSWNSLESCVPSAIRRPQPPTPCCWHRVELALLVDEAGWARGGGNGLARDDGGDWEQQARVSSRKTTWVGADGLEPPTPSL